VLFEAGLKFKISKSLKAWVIFDLEVPFGGILHGNKNKICIDMLQDAKCRFVHRGKRVPEHRNSYVSSNREINYINGAIFI
jgi:hypothetical protein